MKRIGWVVSGCAWILGVFVLVPQLLAAATLARASSELTLAYIDPGTGSFIVQALVAAVAGIAVTLRLYWSKIRGFFGGTTVAVDDASDPTRDDD